MNVKLDCDLHIHSVASGHAFNTIDEIINYSSENGYKIIGISDHGPDMEGAPHAGYFECLYRLPKEKNGMKILYGCEANIINELGEIDLPDSTIAGLDYVMAGLHKRTSYMCNDCSINTKSILAAIESHKIDIITHPISINYMIDPVAVVEAAANNNVILEMNKSVLISAINLKNDYVIAQIKSLYEYAVSIDAKLILGSDAHYITEIGISQYEADLIQNTYSISINNMLNVNPKQLLSTLIELKSKRGFTNE